jgi:hypothetical protein
MALPSQDSRQPVADLDGRVQAIQSLPEKKAGFDMDCVSWRVRQKFLSKQCR